MSLWLGSQQLPLRTRKSEQSHHAPGIEDNIQYILRILEDQGLRHNPKSFQHGHHIDSISRYIKFAHTCVYKEGIPWHNTSLPSLLESSLDVEVSRVSAGNCLRRLYANRIMH